MALRARDVRDGQGEVIKNGEVFFLYLLFGRALWDYG
jgi:hypothetical protein